MINNNVIDMNKVSVRKGEKLINITLRIDEEMLQVLQKFTKEYNFNSIEETILSILEDELFEHDENEDENENNVDIIYEDNNVEVL